MVIMIGGTLNYVFGLGGSLLDLLGFSLVESILILISVILVSISARLFYVWYTRIRPRKPSTNSDWNTDCEFQSSVESAPTTAHFVSAEGHQTLTSRSADFV